MIKDVVIHGAHSHSLRTAQIGLRLRQHAGSPKKAYPAFVQTFCCSFCSTSISDTKKLIEALRHLASALLDEGLVVVDWEIPLPHTLPLLLTARNVLPSVISAADVQRSSACLVAAQKQMFVGNSV
jgi:hypothetical protein